MREKVVGYVLKHGEVFAALTALGILYLTSFYSYLLFHTLSELIATVTAFGIFIVIWNTRRFWDNNYLLVVGISFFFVAFVQLLHSLSYKGMGVFPEYSANLATQLWLVGRYLTAVTFVLAPFLLGRKLLKHSIIFGIYLLVTGAILTSIFFFDIFPVAFVEGSGQTSFKIYSEYFVSAMFAVAIVLLYLKREAFNTKIFYLLIIALTLKMVRELIFTFYANVYDVFNLVGHIFLVLSYYFIYLAFIENTIKHPFRSLFKNLKDSEVALRESEERYRSIVELSPDAVVVHVNRKIMYINTAALVFLGAKSKEEVLGRDLMDFVVPTYKPVVEERLKKMLEGNTVPLLNDLKLVKPQGAMVEVEVTSRCIIYKGEVAIQSIFHDITERKHVEEVLRDSVNFSEGVIATIWEPLIVVDKKLQVKFANTSFCNFFQTDLSSIENKSLKDIEGGEFAIPKMLSQLRESIEGKERFYYFEIEKSFSKIGSKILKVTIGKIKKPKKDTHLFLISIADVTEERVMEGRLRDYAELMKREKAEEKALLSSLGDGIVSIDAKGNVLYVNRAFEDIVKIDSDELQTKRFSEVIALYNSTNELVQNEEMPIERALSTGEKVIVGNVGSAPFYLKTKSNKIAVSITASPVIFEDKLRGVIAIFRDVTKEREIDRAKTEFISLASHQLRTPLAGISLSAELLLRGIAGHVESSQKEYLTEIYESTQRMTTLVSTLLNISRIEMGTLVMKAEPLDLINEIDAIISDLREQTLVKKLNIQKKFDKDIHLINFDRNALRIMTENLISNAIRYTPEKGTITISAKADGDKIIIQVSDTGCGIPKSDQNKVFSRLFRAGNAKEISSDGFGLGLYVSKLLAEKTNSTIWFESKEKKGTTFFISFPRVSTN